MSGDGACTRFLLVCIYLVRSSHLVILKLRYRDLYYLLVNYSYNSRFPFLPHKETSAEYLAEAREDLTQILSLFLSFYTINFYHDCDFSFYFLHTYFHSNVFKLHIMLANYKTVYSRL